MHLHGSFAGHLIISLRSSYLQQKDQLEDNDSGQVERELHILIPMTDGEYAPGRHWDRGQHKAWRTSAGCYRSLSWPEKDRIICITENTNMYWIKQQIEHYNLCVCVTSGPVASKTPSVPLEHMRSITLALSPSLMKPMSDSSSANCLLRLAISCAQSRFFIFFIEMCIGMVSSRVVAPQTWNQSPHYT